MRHAITLLFLTVLFSGETVYAQDTFAAANQTGSITVKLTGFENDQGAVKLCVCRSDEEYTGKAKEFCTASTELQNKKAEWTFEHMPYGRYSIKVFHDENGNNKLDTNCAGIPTERYGFSNNARGQFGPPPFVSTAFTLNSPQIKIAIEVK